MNKEINFRKSLRLEILVYFFIGFVVPIVIIVAGVTKVFIEGLHRELVGNTVAMSRIVHTDLQQLTNKLRANIVERARTDIVTELVAAAMQGEELDVTSDDEVQIVNALTNLVAYLKQTSNTDITAMFNANGVRLASTDFSKTVEKLDGRVMKNIQSIGNEDIPIHAAVDTAQNLGFSKDENTPVYTEIQKTKDMGFRIDFCTPVVEPFYGYIEGFLQETIFLDNEYIEEIKSKTGLEIALFSVEKAATYTSPTAPVLNPDTFDALVESKSVTQQDTLFMGGDKYHTVLVPIQNNDGTVFGAIGVLSSEKSIQENVRTIGILAGIVFLMIIFFPLIIYRIFTNRITKPILDIASAARKIGKGDFSHRIEQTKGENEINELITSLNQMAVDLKDLREKESKKEELERLYDKLKSSHEKIQKTQSQLVQAGKMAAVGQLAGGIAHEINNPMAVILGFSKLLLEDIDKDHPLRLAAESIEREAIRCKNLVGDLLVFSRSSEKGRDYLDLNDVVNQVVSLAEHQTKMSNIEIIKELASNIPIYGDKNALEQVVINLVVNAKDAMPDGGTITVKTWRDGEKGFVSVADTGTGMSKGVLERIFEPFYTTKEVGKGTGLGLSLIYEIIQAHSGNIKVDSEEGKGTCFTIELFLKEQDLSKKKHKILIIDDDEISVKLLEDMFSRMDERFEVHSATDGYKGILQVKDIAPELIVTDIRMPKIDGIKALRQIRQRYGNDKIKIFVITGYPDDITDEIKEELNIDRIFTKPIDLKSLRERVKEMFPK